MYDFDRPRNGCRECGLDFSSLEGFDAHRVGKHEHLFSADHPNGRRCISEAELEAKGYALDATGRWHDAGKADQTRKAFSGLALTPKDALGAQKRPHGRTGPKSLLPDG